MLKKDTKATYVWLIWSTKKNNIDPGLIIQGLFIFVKNKNSTKLIEGTQSEFIWICVSSINFVLGASSDLSNIFFIAGLF